MFRRPLASLALAAALATLAVSTAQAAIRLGPPWISIELPANPLDPSTKGAFLLVRTYHHDKAIPFTVEGRAEGMVNGERRTIKLSFDPTSKEGVLALRKSWPSEGAWVLVITGMPGENAITALVSIAEDGEVRQVRVPTRLVENGRWTVPAKVTQADVETALRQVSGSASLGAR